MSSIAELVERSGPLKRQLIEFLQLSRFREQFLETLNLGYDDDPATVNREVSNAMDRFMLQHRLPDGRTLVEHFVEAHPELPEEERQMLLGWRDVVESIFEVQRRDDDVLIVENLIDELTYRVHSNMGRRAWLQMPPRSCFAGRLVPVRDEWLMSGAALVYPASIRRQAYEIARQAAEKNPAAAFRNPAKLERAWEAQNRLRRRFIEFAGSDEVVVPGSELKERTQAYWHYHRDRHLAEYGPPETESAGEGGDPYPIPDLPMPEELTRLVTVGIIFDEGEGLCYVPNYGAAREAFANPRLIEDEHYRDIVLGYLESEGIRPWVLRRLAWRDPERASQVFRRLLNIPGFQWESDGEDLLRIYKPDTVDLVPTPAVVTTSRRLSEFSREAQAEPPAEARAPGPGRPGRNDPCPCGSGKKYKRCCGR